MSAGDVAARLIDESRQPMPALPVLATTALTERRTSRSRHATAKPGGLRDVMERTGIEPVTSGLQSPVHPFRAEPA
jgi:hypothetical protein